MSIVIFVCAGLLVFLALVATALALFARRTARRVEQFLPPIGKFIDADGNRLHVVDRGAGPPIVMIHGLGGQLRHFTHSLAGRLEGEFRLIIVDRPGCGYSTRAPGASARLSVQANTVAKLIRSLGLERPLIVGHSLGGAVSLALALQHPDCVGGLALVAPLTHPRDKPPEVFKRLAIPFPLLRRWVAWTVAIPIGIATAKETLAFVFGPEAVPADFGTAGGGLLSLRPSAFFAASTDMVAVNEDLPGMVGRYGTLAVPVGILFGRGDRLLDPQEHGAAMAAKVPGLQYTLRDGGHMLPLTAPDDVAQWIRAQALRLRPS